MLDSRETFDKVSYERETRYPAQLLETGLSVNLCDFYTRLIKDAARCNAFSSDIVYDINIINERLKNFRPDIENEPIWIGFRKLGVDSTCYVMCTFEETDGIDKYFALYSLDIQKVEGYFGFYEILVREYDV